MAVTGFWPIYKNLKATLDYADNPDKTTDRRYLDDDLYAALSYAENDNKTDRKMYVGGINCSKQNAYSEMIAVQRRFGIRGKVVGYHGIQSFAAGEVTPEQAFEIGKATARKMWGDRYQVLVTVHLNTDNAHCHFVVNPVSFKDGTKFQNKIGDHKELRRVSDEICREHGLSVLENSNFYGGNKKDYWRHKSGKKTHRDYLREDVEYCLSFATSPREFESQLYALGYTLDPVRFSVKAKHWERSVRLDKIGFSKEVIQEQLDENAKKHGYTNTMFFVDDGISGTSFDRNDFNRMHRMVEEGKIGTIIVKDLSRFGREHIEGGRLAEIVYPTLGVTFISIQENVNSSTGEGMEMLPFYNIFNEWYAAQTSKKIRAVWQSKSDNGERVSATVAFGYRKADDDSKQWVIDEPAAKVVRYIFQLCIEGLGVTKIARRLEAEKILTPTAYYNSIGRKTRNKVIDPYRWSENSVDHILANMQYTGCTVNFKSSTVSFKVHKTVYNSPEDWVIIPNTQEAIIDMDTWERVQEIKKHRRRNTATGRQSIFSGLMYCGDCGSKLYFCAAKSVKEHQEFYRCSAYKENRGSCTIHFIRNVVLERMVLKLIREAAEYITEYEPVFLYLYSKQHQLNKANNLKAAKQELEKNKKRIVALDKLIEAAFEKNVLGTLRDDLFERMTANYEKEQKELIQAVAEAEQRLANAEQDNIDLRAFLSIIRKCTDLKELTPELVNRLITKIEVFDSTKDENGKKHVPIKVHFIGVGVLEIPDGKTILETYEEIRKNPPIVA